MQSAVGLPMTPSFPQKESYPENCAIHVGNLHNECIPEEIYEHFKLCGEVKRITIKINRETGERMGFAYVDFADPQNAEDAMVLDGSDFKGQAIKVNKKRAMQDFSGKMGGKGKGGKGFNFGGFGFGKG